MFIRKAVTVFSGGFGSLAFSDWMGRLELFLKLDGFLPGKIRCGMLP
jgi:hypothetical protein